MIDMHCHIIPNVDDGSSTLKMSIEMAKKAYEHGYTAIFATPHFIQINHENYKEDVYRNVKKLNDILKGNGINIEIYPGNEVYYTLDIIPILSENKKICTLNDTRYFIIEFPMHGNIIDFESYIAAIVKSGYRPIIAHPERYEFVNKNLDVLKNAIQIGALLQINVASILGLYGSIPKKNVKKLLKNNMVHFIGTDAHDDIKVYKLFDKSINKISKIIGKEKLHQILYENSKKVKDDVEIIPEFID